MLDVGITQRTPTILIQIGTITARSQQGYLEAGCFLGVLL